MEERGDLYLGVTKRGWSSIWLGRTQLMQFVDSISNRHRGSWGKMWRKKFVEAKDTPAVPKTIYGFVFAESSWKGGEKEAALVIDQIKGGGGASGDTKKDELLSMGMRWGG